MEGELGSLSTLLRYVRGRPKRPLQYQRLAVPAFRSTNLR
jgi:hypothetical protein